MTPGSGSEAWATACLALDLLRLDTGLGGICLRARAGAVRDTFLSVVKRDCHPVVRLHPFMTPDALTGGLDMAATLASGRVVRSAGLLAQPGLRMLSMAERCPADIAAILAAELDAQTGPLILLDEGASDEEFAPDALGERLAFHVGLDAIGRLEAIPPPRRTVDDLPDPSEVALPDGSAEDLTRLAARLGVLGMRAPLLAVRAARAHAALNGRTTALAEDLTAAARLVLAPRAVVDPVEDLDPPPPEQPAPPEQEPADQGDPANADADMGDILVDAVRAVMLQGLVTPKPARQRNVHGNGAGARHVGNRRGRPLPARPGKTDPRARVDILATLRAAIPFQALRGRGADMPVRVLPSDLRYRRHEQKSDRLLIFVVDASGSAAIARLGEAKGAVEILLSRAYSSRDRVALVAFRDRKAELLLPPTQSLVQAKRRLAELAGGGGTPLAHGLQTGGELALHMRTKGMTPMIALLTDGRGNIALDGSASRAQAQEDSTTIARWLRGEGLGGMVLDLGIRPSAALAGLASDMDAEYFAVPRANAAQIGDRVSAVMQDGLA